MLFRIASLSVLATLLMGSLPVKAQSCIPLLVVDGEHNQIIKTISPPGTLVTDDNWDTSWSIPNDREFRRFFLLFIPSDSSQYHLEVNLAYENNSTDQFYYQNDVNLIADQNLSVLITPQSNQEPMQVNLMVGGLQAIGSSYSASVVGCE